MAIKTTKLLGFGRDLGEVQNEQMYGGLWDKRKDPAALANATNVGPGGTSAIANVPGAVPGLPARAYDPAYGGIPQVPLPATSQADAIAANLKNLSSLLDLSSQLNAFNLAQQRKQYEASFPNYAATEAQIAKNIGAGARGELSPGTMRNLANAAAQRAVASGMPIDQGGPTAGNMNYLNLLGTTSEQLQQNAINQLGAYNALSPRTALFNPAAFAISPEAQYNAALQASVFNAAPVPSAAAQAAINAAKAGARFGFGGARAPGFSGGYQAPSTGANLLDIFSRYAPTARLNPNQYMPNANQGAGTGAASQYNPSFIQGSAINAPAYTPQNIVPLSQAPPSYVDYSAFNQTPWTPYDPLNYNTVPTQLYPPASGASQLNYYKPTGNEAFDEILWNVENAY